MQYRVAFTLCLLAYSAFAAEQQHTSLLPASLEGQTFLFTVDSTASSDNPNASVSYLMSFAKETYQYQIIGTNSVLTGKFQYVTHQEPLGPIGVITATELFDNTPSTYQMVLVPKDNATGLYLYKQSSGAIKPDVRMNSARYTRVLF